MIGALSGPTAPSGSAPLMMDGGKLEKTHGKTQHEGGEAANTDAKQRNGKRMWPEREKEPGGGSSASPHG